MTNLVCDPLYYKSNEMVTLWLMLIPRIIPRFLIHLGDLTSVDCPRRTRHVTPSDVIHHKIGVASLIDTFRMGTLDTMCLKFQRKVINSSLGNGSEWLQHMA